MDDICVISKTFQGHLENLQDTFAALRKNGLHIKDSKCSFATEEITFLGHKVAREGVEPLHSKVEVVQKWLAPTKVSEFKGIYFYSNATFLPWGKLVSN